MWNHADAYGWSRSAVAHRPNSSKRPRKNGDGTERRDAGRLRSRQPCDRTWPMVTGAKLSALWRRGSIRAVYRRRRYGAKRGARSLFIPPHSMGVFLPALDRALDAGGEPLVHLQQPLTRPCPFLLV